MRNTRTLIDVAVRLIGPLMCGGLTADGSGGDRRRGRRPRQRGRGRALSSSVPVQGRRRQARLRRIVLHAADNVVRPDRQHVGGRRGQPAELVAGDPGRHTERSGSRRRHARRHPAQRGPRSHSWAGRPLPESGVRKMTTLIDVEVRLLGPLMRGALTAASAVIAGKTATRRVSAITGTDHIRHDRALTSARRSARCDLCLVVCIEQLTRCRSWIPPIPPKELEAEGGLYHASVGTYGLLTCTPCHQCFTRPELLGVGEMEVRQVGGHLSRRYRRPSHVPVPAAPALDRLHGRRRHGDRGDDQPRVLAAAPPRRAPGVQRRRGGAHRPAGGRPRRAGPDRTPPSATTSSPTSSGDRSRSSGSYLPDEELRVVNRSQGGRAGDNVVTPLLLDDGRVAPRRPWVRAPRHRGGGGSDRRRHRRRAPAPLRGPPHRGAVRSRATGDLTEAQRVDIPRLAAQLPGDVVPMYVELTASDPPSRATSRSRSPSRRSAKDRTSRTPCSGSSSRRSSPIGWFLAVRRSRKVRP